MTPLRFYDFMRAGHVKRWHIVNTVREQTIAEHQYLVTIIAMELFSKIRMHKEHSHNDGGAWLALIVGAMFSDAPEVRYGDYPTPAKVHIKELAGPDLFEKMDGLLMPYLPYVGGDVPPGLRDIIRLADAIEAAHWISENKAGIHSEAVAKGASRRMAEMVVQLSKTSGIDWFEPVNQVLIELGMPYISKAMLVTPP